MRLWIENVAPETSDEELSAFLRQYGLPAHSDMARLQGDGSRDVALIKFSDVHLVLLYQVAFKLDGIQWKGKAITVAVSAY